MSYHQVSIIPLRVILFYCFNWWHVHFIAIKFSMIEISQELYSLLYLLVGVWHPQENEIKFLVYLFNWLIALPPQYLIRCIMKITYFSSIFDWDWGLANLRKALENIYWFNVYWVVSVCPPNYEFSEYKLWALVKF